MSRAFDVVFAGGGTTACVIAGRLAATDPSLKILVLESGQHTRNLPIHEQPCRYIEHSMPGSTTVSCYVAKPILHLDGRALVTQCGHALGGGSTVNLYPTSTWPMFPVLVLDTDMVYMRGAASDYDGWGAFGNKGWTLGELLPLIRKFETFAPISGRPTHGDSGPIRVSAGGVDLGVGRQFLDVAKAYDPARPVVDDNNDFKTPNAYSPCYKYIDPVTGKRSDAASRYLYPHPGNPNLEVTVGKRVKRVLIKNGRAIGIEYTSGTMSGQETSDEVVTVMATKLIVVSAGALGSPAILERSGIGAPSILERNDVRVVVDLPDVGEHYQDHFGACPVFYASDKTETMDDVWSDPKVIAENLKEWEDNGTGKIAHNGIEAVMKMRPTEKQLASAGPALQQRWETFFQHNPDKPMGLMAPFAGFPLDPSLFHGQKLLFSIYCTLYPESTGSVHITSGKDVNSAPDFDPNIFSKASDPAQLALMYKMTRELLRRMPAYREEVAAFHPKFLPDSPAACRETDKPVAIDAPDLVYSDADDEVIAKFHRDTVFTTWHSLGTCAMKPRDLGGVVDSRLNVYGVKGLKVADMSICPTNVGNNTYSTALLIGEKAATIIAEDLGMEITW